MDKGGVMEWKWSEIDKHLDDAFRAYSYELDCRLRDEYSLWVGVDLASDRGG